MIKNSFWYILFVVVVALSSCIFNAQTKCSHADLLKDSLLFKNPTADVIIDKSWCLVWQDYSYYIKGRIQNGDSLKGNLQMLGINKFDTLRAEMPTNPTQQEKIIDWFNVKRLNQDNGYLKYYWKFKNTSTYKWIYYKDEAVCDTFYISLINA